MRKATKLTDKLKKDGYKLVITGGVEFEHNYMKKLQMFKIILVVKKREVLFYYTEMKVS